MVRILWFKLRSHMCGAVAERRRADFDIPAPLPRVCSHIRGADAGGSAISWGQWWFGARGYKAGAVNLVLDPLIAVRFLLPLRDRACVNTCCWALQTTNSTQRPGSPKNTTQHHDVSVQSTLDRRPMYYSQKMDPSSPNANAIMWTHTSLEINIKFKIK